MFSTKCGSCRQLINLSTEEVRAAIAEAEGKHEKIYVMNCPKCRKVVKIQVSQLKLKLPREVAEQPVRSENSEESNGQ
jgi:hypothetical protein